jgi:CBS domain-containing protein
MARFNITAIPVTKSTKDTTILGFVSTLDMLAHLCKLIGVQEQEGAQIDTENFHQKVQEFKQSHIADLVDTSGKTPFCLMHGGESLADAVQSYLKGIHRIAITDDEGDLTGVVSQWTIANYIATVPTDDKEWIPTLQAPVGQSKYTKDPKFVNKKEKALHCFCKMYTCGVSALPIVDDEGNLCGNISASDLRPYQLYLESADDLLRPVSEFIGLIRKQQGRPENFAIAVTPDTKVKDVVTKFNEEIVHRAYIVDNQKLLGVFTLTDMLKDLVVDTHTTATFAKSTARTQISE